jgi:preprotein translocase subunit SecB
MTDTAAPDQAQPQALPDRRLFACWRSMLRTFHSKTPACSPPRRSPALPEIELGIDVRVEPGPPDQGIFSVELKLSARAKRQDTVVFIVELVYGGVVQLQDARREDAEPMLLIECPRLLFPFARRIIADITREGGHPP